MNIIIDDLRGQEIADFLAEHIADMKSISPPESKHALDLEGLRQPDITFWSVWDNHTLIGCGAIKALDSLHCEIKSMRVSATCRGQGVASFILNHLLTMAKQRGFRTVSLETGTMPFFDPAHKLYTKFGFVPCPPFGHYKADPNSLFMSRTL